MKKILLLTLLLSISAFSEEKKQTTEKKSKEKSSKVAEEKPKAKKKKKFEGHFFTFLGARLPVDDIYGGNIELGYILNRGRLRSYVSVMLEHFHFDADVVKPGDTSGDKYNAAQLGFKAGALMPFTAIAPFITVGSLKTSVQKDPWLGKREGAVSLKNIFFGEIGTYIYYKRVAIGYHFRYSTSIVSNIDTFVSLGVFY
jgi:hypothetical protein